MSVIAGIQDFRQEAPPADIGAYQLTTNVIVFQFTFSGTAYYAAMRGGVRSWDLISYGTDITVVIEAAWTELASGGTLITQGPGTWVIPSQIDSQGTHLTWISDWSLTLQAAVTIGGNIINCTHDSLTLIGLRLDGNKAAMGAVNQMNLNMTDCDHCIVERVWSYDAKDDSGTGTGGYGIWIRGTDNHIIDCLCDTNDWDNIHVNENVDTLVKGCICDGAGNANINLYADAGDSQTRVIVEDCISKNAGNWGIEIYRNATFCKIVNCIGYGDDKGFPICTDSANPCHYCAIENCIVISPDNDLCYHLEENCTNNKISDCIAYDSPQEGIRTGGDNNTICDNVIYDTLQDGISITNTGDRNKIDGNRCYDCGYSPNYFNGIKVMGNRNTTTDNWVYMTQSYANITAGIKIDSGDNNTVEDNYVEGYNSTDKYGIGVLVTDGATGTLIEGNYIFNMDGGWDGNGIHIDDGDGTKVIGNVIEDCDNGVYLVDGDDCSVELNTFDTCTLGIDLSAATVVRCRLTGGNHFIGCTTCITDNGTSTLLPTIPKTFMEGVTFIWADASPKGWEIDEADEYAIAFVTLPLGVQQVVRIKIWGVGLAAPGVGNQMRLEININAGQDDEAYTAEAIAIANKNNVTENFAVNDVIHWMIDATDDADIGDLIGGDQLEIKVKHEIAGNGDIATDAILRTVDIEYV